MLIDADGLNVLARHLDWLKGHQSPIIITPHPGEMARLIQKKTKEVVDDLWEIAKTFSEEYQVICVQKDARTLVMSPSSEAYINLSGNEGMATAGAGDVLTGIIAGLIGQGCMPYEASCLGVYIHGLAGDHIRHTLGTYSMMASDIIDALSVIVAH